MRRILLILSLLLIFTPYQSARGETGNLTCPGTQLGFQDLLAAAIALLSQAWFLILLISLCVSLLLTAGFWWRMRTLRQQNVQLQKIADEQKRVANDLRQSEARFRAMFENAAIGISLISPDGHVLAVNPVLVKLAGRSEAELITLGGQGITYPEDQEIGRKEFYEVVSGVRDSYQTEKRYVHKDGRIQWMRQSISSVREPDGKLLYLIVIAEDIDDRKRAVEELRQSEARFKAIFESSAVGIGVLDADTKILRINERAMQMLGQAHPEIQIRNLDDLLQDNYRSQELPLYHELLDGRRDSYDTERMYEFDNRPTIWAKVTFPWCGMPKKSCAM